MAIPCKLCRKHFSGVIWWFYRGSKVERSTTTVDLYSDGYNRYRLDDVLFLLENPLSFIRSTAIIKITWVFDNKTSDTMQHDLFTLQNITWTTADDQYLNISLSRPAWYLALSYRKGCARGDYFAFDCSIYCPKPITTIECYNCNNVTGRKECCRQPEYDPGYWDRIW